MFRWTPEATEEQKQQVAAELRRLPALLPVLRAYHVGPDLGLPASNANSTSQRCSSQHSGSGSGILTARSLLLASALS